MSKRGELDEETIRAINEAVERIDIEEVIEEAESMGITVNKKRRGYHTIRDSETGEYVRLDLDKHLRFGR